MIEQQYLDDAHLQLRKLKSQADKAIAQIKDDDLFALIDPDANSIAIIMKHLAGNMRSRWTEFLTTDGEKPDRNRDSEFVEPPMTREALMEMWETGWRCVWSALEPLKQEDLGRTVTIRGEAHSVLQAINRQIAHYAYHVGQIVMLAKHFQGESWRSLTIPKKKGAIS